MSYYGSYGPDLVWVGAMLFRRALKRQGGKKKKIMRRINQTDRPGITKECQVASRCFTSMSERLLKVHCGQNDLQRFWAEEIRLATLTSSAMPGVSTSAKHL